MKTEFYNFLNEKFSDDDPFGEDGTVRMFIILAEDGRRIYLSKNVKNEAEAIKKFEKKTGCTDGEEYGKVKAVETNQGEVNVIIRDLRREKAKVIIQ